jgi:hypothetical protein
VEDAGEIRRAGSETLHECILCRCIVANANDMDGFVCSIGEESQSWLLWQGWAERVPMQTGDHVVKHQGVGWGVI